MGSISRSGSFNSKISKDGKYNYMDYKINRGVLFNKYASQKVDKDGSQGEIGEAKDIVDDTKIQRLLKSIGTCSKLDIYGERSKNIIISEMYRHKEEKRIRDQEQMLSRLKVQEVSRNANEEAIRTLIYGDKIGKGYIHSILRFIKDNPDTDFKQAIYAHCCDLTHGSLEIQRQISTPIIKDSEKKWNVLVQNDELFEYWRNIKDIRKKEGSTNIGIEESLLTRNIYLNIVAALEGIKKKNP
eukprot:GHVP01069566.1.p1 GENE.GHVP01069566.1~~GHVP01069566.1.p1  ORF type:complete len:242 (+),score=51.12 GHVP01069566.1:1066-1791(+)